MFLSALGLSGALGVDWRTAVAQIVYTVLGVYLALVLHEIAHGLVALWNGDPTAKNMGRLSMNPLKHFDLIGLIMMLAIGFGYAKPVPVNPYNFKKYRTGLFTVAIAGICMNIILAFFSVLLFYLFGLGYYNYAGTTGGDVFFYISGFFSYFAQLNVALAFFNLLPIFPLDGFRIIESFTHQGNKYCRFMRNNGQYILWGLVGLSFIVSTALNYAPVDLYWIRYFDVLGLYIDTCSYGVLWVFNAFWGLMFPFGGAI